MQSVYAMFKQSFQTYRRITYKNTYGNTISMYFLFLYEYDTVYYNWTQNMLAIPNHMRSHRDKHTIHW